MTNALAASSQPAVAGAPVSEIVQVVRKGEKPPRIVAKAPPTETPVDLERVGNISARADGPAPENIVNMKFINNWAQKYDVKLDVEVIN